MKYESVTETDVVIDLRDGKKIHGLLRGELGSSNPVVVMMHGMPGTPKNPLIYLGSRYLYEHGFTTLALYMYDYPEQYRDLYDCVLATHVSDYEDVLSYLREKGVRTIYSVGHSFGGLTIIKSKSTIEGAVLWDPSHGLAWQDGDVKRDWNVKTDEFVISTVGRGSMRPLRLQRDIETFGDTSADAANLECPVKVITGDKSPIYRFVPKYMDYLPAAKELVVIQGAGHGFDEQDSTMQELFEQTTSWLKEIR